MGMSSSQARLLTLTSRLSDIELKAQRVQSQKIVLATQRDDVYKRYCDALDAKSLKVAVRDGTKTSFVNANFETVCKYNQNRVKQYAIENSKTGKIIVDEKTKENYDKFGNDRYTFAYAMLGLDNNYSWYNQNNGCEIGIGTANNDYGYSCNMGTGQSLYMTDSEKRAYEKLSQTDTTLANKYQILLDAQTDEEKEAALEDFRKELYSKEEFKIEIYNQMIIDKTVPESEATSENKPTWDEISNEFNYYVNLWTAINEAGGCEIMDKQFDSGEEGDEWFQNMVNAGLITIKVFDDNNSKNQWTDTSISTSVNENYLKIQEDDSDLKKAEAEYEHNLGVINDKDKEYDLELSKLETERTALTTEIDSIKTSRDDNTERTFGIFG